MNKNVLGTLGIVLAIILGAIGTFRHISPSQPQIVGGTSPEISSPYLSVGGITEWYARTILTQATTTICAIQSPAATSTLSFASLHIDVASSTTNTITFARAATPYATTTVIQASQPTIASAVEGNIVASSTIIFSPNQYLVIGQAGNGAGAANNNFSESGICQAKWTQISY